MDKALVVSFWEEAKKDPQRRVFFHKHFGEFLKTLPDAQNDPESDDRPGKRTDSQNKAIHLWLELVAEELDRHGHTVQDVVARIKRAEIRPNKTVLKEVLWRPYQIAALGKESTTELTKHEVDKVYEGLNKFIGQEFEIHIPFPSDETRSRPTLEAMKVEKRLPDYPEDIGPPNFDGVDK